MAVAVRPKTGQQLNAYTLAKSREGPELQDTDKRENRREGPFRETTEYYIK